MSAEILGLHGRTPPAPNGAEPDVIAALEHWLEKARAGDLIGVGVVAVCQGDHVFVKSYGKASQHVMVAGCEYLKHDICANTGNYVPAIGDPA